MPFICGEELIKLFNESETPPTPKDIVIITAALGHNVQDIKRMGYTVIEKPMDLANLEHIILDDCEKYNLAIKK